MLEALAAGRMAPFIVLQLLWAAVAEAALPASPDTFRPIGKATWNYATVRPGAHMFWYLEPCIECHHEAITDEPLLIWLQGGPGASSTGFGNFEEIGPWEVGWHKRRRHTWATRANLLFIDAPVGTGWSYVEPGTSFAQSNAEVSADLMSLLRQFLQGHPEFKSTPAFIFSESYGGKVAIKWARDIVHAEHLDFNLQGVALGDSWISGVAFVQAWPEFLQAFSLLDDHGRERLEDAAAATQAAVVAGNFTYATQLWSDAEFLAENLTDSVSFYDVLLHEPGTVPAANAWLATQQPHARIPLAARKLLHRHHGDKLTHFMNHQFRRELRIIPDEVIWGGQAGAVFSNLTVDFMKSVALVVDEVLQTGLPVHIYQGQLDLICCTLGVDAWLRGLQWDGLAGFQNSSMQALHRGQQGSTKLLRKRHRNLSMYTVLEAGHMVPADQPAASLLLVDDIFSFAAAAAA